MAEPIQRDALAGALGLGHHELVALVGGGGKTTLLFALGRALAGRVVLTTTTKMNPRRTEGLPVLWAPSDDQIAGRSTTIVWHAEREDKALGVDPEAVDRWFALVDHVVVEADGARNKPCKAPAPHEPVIPSRTTFVAVVIGADALDRVIEDQCFRPLRVAALAGCSSYERLTVERAAAVLTADRGGRKGVPPGARFAVVITKVGDPNRALADALCDALAVRGVTAIEIADQPPHSYGGPP